MSEPLAYDVKVMPDGNDLILDFLLDQFSDDFAEDRVGTRIPGALAGRLPFAHAFHWQGGSNRLEGTIIVDLSVFADDYSEASLLARRIESKLLGYPFRVSSGGRSVLIDSVRVAVPTVEVPWLEGTSTIRRFQGTYELSVRR